MGQVTVPPPGGGGQGGGGTAPTDIALFKFQGLHGSMPRHCACTALGMAKGWQCLTAPAGPLMLCDPTDSVCFFKRENRSMQCPSTWFGAPALDDGGYTFGKSISLFLPSHKSPCIIGATPNSQSYRGRAIDMGGIKECCRSLHHEGALSVEFAPVSGPLPGRGRGLHKLKAPFGSGAWCIMI